MSIGLNPVQPSLGRVHPRNDRVSPKPVAFAASAAVSSPEPLTVSRLTAEQQAGLLRQLLPIRSVRFGAAGHLEASIPVVDMAEFRNAVTDAQRLAFAKDFGKKLQKYGFIAVKNHGIDKKLFDRHFELLGEYMRRSPNELATMQFNEIGKLVGYYPPGELKPGPDGRYTEPDPKHMWHSTGSSNVYHPDAREFAAVNKQLFKEMKAVGDTIVDVLALFLDDRQGLLKQFVHSGAEMERARAQLMRSIHYPSLNEAQRQSVRTVDKDTNPKWVRTGEHRDLSLFTLLPEATDSGLQLLPNVPGNDTTPQGVHKPTNQWLDVWSQDGYLILNAGDTLAMITKGLKDEQGNSLEIPSTWHRVVGDREIVSRDRFSVPFFFNANWMNTMPDLAKSRAREKLVPVRLKEAPYNGIPFDPALKMLWKRYSRSDKQSQVPYRTFSRNYRNQEATIQRILAERGLSVQDYYHAGL